ncbi:MazG nucleotide pyrophosphohydrolase domain-containing protein [Corynebacterium epidermidicanis]|uniref:MazG nucleotide pyrophosphohydrolase domain-containing protein n=1 Tax=Corynebacterium epidermidicanis TaxID=1050174 RepID=UPI001F21F63A|nr:MazG nucleotide pyrophosphohydrolase domain-containing protein [Corynebacterium epidermidicanis]
MNKIIDAVEVMSRALEIGEWERSMTHLSLLPFLVEEAAEFADAVRAHHQHATADSERELKNELSDVLLQVLFHAELARRRGAFDIGDVAQAFVDKLQARAPYLFDGTSEIVQVAEQERLWQLGKQRQQ